MRIKTNDFILRQWKQGDAPRLAEIANNKKIFDNLRDVFPYPYSVEDATNYISFVENDTASEIFAIEIDNVVVGNIGAHFQEDVYRKNAEIGYYLAEEYWGKGIMTKAIKVFVKHVFDNFDIIRVYAEPFARNVGSRRALEKAGFRLEAVLKNNIVKNGIVEDGCIYAILNLAWAKFGSSII